MFGFLRGFFSGRLFGSVFVSVFVSVFLCRYLSQLMDGTPPQSLIVILGRFFTHVLVEYSTFGICINLPFKEGVADQYNLPAGHPPLTILPYVYKHIVVQKAVPGGTD